MPIVRNGINESNPMALILSVLHVLKEASCSAAQHTTGARPARHLVVKMNTTQYTVKVWCRAAQHATGARFTGHLAAKMETKQLRFYAAVSIAHLTHLILSGSVLM